MAAIAGTVATAAVHEYDPCSHRGNGKNPYLESAGNDPGGV